MQPWSTMRVAQHARPPQREPVGFWWSGLPGILKRENNGKLFSAKGPVWVQQKDSSHMTHVSAEVCSECLQPGWTSGAGFGCVTVQRSPAGFGFYVLWLFVETEMTFLRQQNKIVGYSLIKSQTCLMNGWFRHVSDPTKMFSIHTFFCGT